MKKQKLFNNFLCRSTCVSNITIDECRTIYLGLEWGRGDDVPKDLVRTGQEMAKDIVNKRSLDISTLKDSRSQLDNFDNQIDDLQFQDSNQEKKSQLDELLSDVDNLLIDLGEINPDNVDKKNLKDQIEKANKMFDRITRLIILVGSQLATDTTQQAGQALDVVAKSAAETPAPRPGPSPAGGVAAADETDPGPTPAAPAQGAEPAPAAPTAPKKAVETAEKTAQQKCEIMKKYVGDGKLINTADFNKLLAEHGGLPDAKFGETGADADKIVAAVEKLQGEAVKKLPDTNPLKTSPALRDGIFGQKTFEACKTAEFILAPTSAEAAPAAPEAPAPAEPPAAAPAPAPEEPEAKPETPTEQIPTFDYNTGYDKFYAIKHEISDDATRQAFKDRKGEVVYIRDPQKDIQGDQVTVELSNGKHESVPKGILSNLKGVTETDESKIKTYMAKRYEQMAQKLKINRGNIKILNGQAVLTTPHIDNPTIVDTRPSTGKGEQNVALARFSDTPATEDQKNQYIIERCEAEATLRNSA